VLGEAGADGDSDLPASCAHVSRTGPGRRPEIPDWALTVLIMVAVLKGRKSKSSQYRYLAAHREDLLAWLSTDQFPAPNDIL